MKTHRKVSGLSGNEIYCLNKSNFTAGQLCVGNSVIALGVGRSIGAGLSVLGGGEVEEVTRLVYDGRLKAFDRMMQEARENGGAGITGVDFEVINHGSNLEFITTGSAIHKSDEAHSAMFSTSADAQELYCQLDAGFEPLHFVFGNVAYSIGVGGGIGGAFRSLARGEVPQYSQIFDHTRHLALQRIIGNAKSFGANSVIGIRTSISPVLGTQEMMMVGTASRHPLLNAYTNEPVTSDMTNEEMWNMVNLGYMPLRLVMGVSVYSLGFTGGVAAFFKTLGGGEIAGLTEILYEAREKALERIEAEAERYGADEVVGVKTSVYDIGGGMVEFLAIGTAVKKIPGVSTKSPQLLPQAIIVDQDTFVDATDGGGAGSGVGINRAIRASAGSRSSSAAKLQGSPLRFIFIFLIILFYFFKIFVHRH